jgi:hypothetical protein
MVILSVIAVSFGRIARKTAEKKKAALGLAALVSQPLTKAPPLRTRAVALIGAVAPRQICTAT